MSGVVHEYIIAAIDKLNRCVADEALDYIHVLRLFQQPWMLHEIVQRDEYVYRISNDSYKMLGIDTKMRRRRFLRMLIFRNVIEKLRMFILCMRADDDYIVI